MTTIKKIISYIMLFALIFSIVPLPAVHANTATFFIPDDGKLASTANLDLSNPANLDRNIARISNSNLMDISGSYQQVTPSTITLTVDQIVQSGGTWQAQTGKTANLNVGTTGNRFQITGVQLFQGFNRLTFTGTQGSSVKTDVFYVLYDSAPIINSLQISSGGQFYDLNESASLVLNSSTAYIQGNSTNATSITVNGQKASVLSNGLFYAPAATLQPGLNKFDITLSNDTDSITVKRQVYYYSSSSPFTQVDVTQDTVPSSSPETHSVLGVTPTFTSTGNKGTLALTFLVPYYNTVINNASTQITVNSSTPNVTIAGSGAANETVITNTYGAPAYKLVSLTTTPFSLQTDASNNLLPNQPVNIGITYTASGNPTPILISGTFSFNLAAGQKIINNIKLLPNYDGSSAVNDNTIATPLDGSQVTSPDFYVLLDTSQPLTLPGDTVSIALQPLGNANLTISSVGVTSSGTVNKGQVFKVSGLPTGSQSLVFAINNGVPYNAKVSYASKNYIDLQNLYNGQVFTIDSSVPQSIPLQGRMIGFGNRMQGTQLLINNADKTSILNPTAVPNTEDYVFGPINLAIGNTGPLFIGENTITIAVDYTDGNTPAGILRHYNKTVKFYIVDSNAPNIIDVRPLTPPSTPRGSLSDPNPANYLPPSPELQKNGTYYSTTLSKFDIYVQGSGADLVTIKEGANTLYSVNPGNFVMPSPNASYSSSDFTGNRSSFKLRLNDVLIPVGTHVYTIEFDNNNGAKVTQTLEVHSENIPYRILSPVPNTGNKIVVNKNFVLFDVEAVGATDVQINGNSATPRTDIPNRYMYTLTGLKGDTDNTISLVIKKSGGDVKASVVVKYVTDPDVGSMYMEQMSSKHSVFNKQLQMTFPKNTVLRRTIDGKIQPQPNLLFGIADPNNGNTELVNDYGQILGTDIDFRTTKPNSGSQTVIPIDATLATQFSKQLGRNHFTRVSSYYWVSAGMGELSKVGASDYQVATGGLAPYSVQGTFTHYDQRREVVPSERGTLTLKYNDDVVNQVGSEIAVFYLGNDGIWRNIGGTVDSANKTVTVPFDKFGYYVVEKLRYSYDDITNHDWARDILQSLFAKGYMPAIYSDQFGASDYVTRGEFAALLVRSLGLRMNSDNNNTFIDIVPGSQSATWSYDEIETAARAGIVQGLSNLIFAPDKAVTRQDASVMIARALSLKLAVNDSKLQAKLDKAFADSGTINYYARPAVDALNSSGIMVGSPVQSAIPTKAKPLINFNPTSNMTRAEAAQVAVRLLQKYLKALPTNLS
ncbi:S-layer homology domain-containing protein [Paenibacillus filicis]|uniref:S-layer homology domain-containing protein n=1 Tax=Paenibacillus gyeongsangnamensis TaxID=3388067 RepID=A0ABT4QDE7_9BACL|nr:S-layer homology domain-containing protein [Paenibacillus filicis]MCZ8514858.1 S-layer homology domain-containing protein [Paenibacillus filicis]